ncbi:MAG: N-acetyl-gamma-glutamyl-phosphate reductase, partial [Pseudomonadota bacterium]
GRAHTALDLQAEAVYGLTEYYRDEIRGARLVAGTGCNAMTGLLPVLPLLADRIIDADDIMIDLATGVSGAGRAPKEGMLHAEVSEGYRAYNVAAHRHLAEFDQEMSRVAGHPVEVTFTPHLLPQNRGILATVYARGDADAIHAALAARYAPEPFVVVLPLGQAPSTAHVRGSNFAHIGVIGDRRPGRVMVFCTLDNLTKGSSGQAIQNANLMLGLPETTGLMAAPLFP